MVRCVWPVWKLPLPNTAPDLQLHQVWSNSFTIRRNQIIDFPPTSREEWKFKHFNWVGLIGVQSIQSTATGEYQERNLLWDVTPDEGPHVWQSRVGRTIGRVCHRQTIVVWQTRQSSGKAWEKAWEGMVPQSGTESEHVAFLLHVPDDGSLSVDETGRAWRLSRPPGPGPVQPCLQSHCTQVCNIYCWSFRPRRAGPC